jgi:hypothetical protein
MFQATHEYIQLLFVSWPSQLCFIKPFAYKSNGVPILHEDPIDNKVTCVSVDFEQFNETSKHQYRGEQKLLFQVLKRNLLFPFPFERQLFKKVQKWFRHLQKSSYELLVKIGQC